jgi:hypothetical protein
MPLEAHKFANVFPMMSEDEFNSLKKDIAESGLENDIVLYEGKILDGRNRYRACIDLSIAPRFTEYTGSNPLAYVISLNLKRRHLTASQKAAVALQVLPLFEEEAKKRQAHGQTAPGKKLEKKISQAPRSAHQAGKLFGVSGQYVKFAKAIREADSKLFDQIRNGTKSLPQARKTFKWMQRKKEAEALSKQSVIPEGIKFIHSDFRDVVLPEGSVDAIITDPPYGAEYLHLWDDLGAFAKKALRANGFLVAYTGHLYLPQILFQLSKHLTYFWTFALYHEGYAKLQHPRNVICRFKPIVVFCRPPLHGLHTPTEDVIRSEKWEKTKHEWQQSESGVEPLIDIFSKANELIVDPFAGTGTFVRKAYDMKRKAIGIEEDKVMFAECQARFA